MSEINKYEAFIEELCEKVVSGAETHGAESNGPDDVAWDLKEALKIALGHLTWEQLNIFAADVRIRGIIASFGPVRDEEELADLVDSEDDSGAE